MNAAFIHRLVSSLPCDWVGITRVSSMVHDSQRWWKSPRFVDTSQEQVSCWRYNSGLGAVVLFNPGWVV